MNKRFLMRMVIPMITAIILPLGAWMFGFLDLAEATILQFIGISSVLLGNLVWILLVDSSKRWPEGSITNRIIQLFTFSKS
jgi:hypothetical protein